MHRGFCYGNLLENDHLKDQEEDRITLRCISGKQVVSMRTECKWLKIVHNVGFFIRGVQPSGFLPQ
jgi:hypothetical protein